MKVEQVTKIEDVLFGSQFPIRLEKEELTVTYIPQGKASDVYKVELPRNEVTYAAKMLDPTLWQAREIDIYEKYLSGSSLSTPKLLFANRSDGILILSWIGSDGGDLDFDRLAKWLTRKYLIFKSLLEDQTIKIEKNIGWMLLEPANKLVTSQKYLGPQTLHKLKNSLEFMKRKLANTYSLSLPVVLDHGDLEIQNIINASDEIYVIDWANSVRSYGFIDFAQFKKNLREAQKMELCGVYEEEFSRLLNIELSQFTQLVSLFAVIREVQLLAYYMDNNVDMQDLRVASSIAILQDELGVLLS